MATQVTGSKFTAGKVTVGPKIIGECYYRIVSQRDRSGRIESFDRRSQSWIPAPERITFNDVWKAPEASPFFLSLARASAAGLEESTADPEESAADLEADDVANEADDGAEGDARYRAPAEQRRPCLLDVAFGSFKAIAT